MTPDAAALIRATNAELSSFFEKAASPVDMARLSDIQSEIARLLVAVTRIGRSLGRPFSLEDFDEEAITQLRIYSAHLERLKNYLTALERYAEGRREQLIAGTQQIAHALAWCNTLKLTHPE